MDIKNTHSSECVFFEVICLVDNQEHQSLFIDVFGNTL